MRRRYALATTLSLISAAACTRAVHDYTPPHDLIEYNNLIDQASSTDDYTAKLALLDQAIALQPHNYRAKEIKQQLVAARQAQISKATSEATAAAEAELARAADDVAFNAIATPLVNAHRNVRSTLALLTQTVIDLSTQKITRFVAYNELNLYRDTFQQISDSIFAIQGTAELARARNFIWDASDSSRELCKAAQRVVEFGFMRDVQEVTDRSKTINVTLDAARVLLNQAHAKRNLPLPAID